MDSPLPGVEGVFDHVAVAGPSVAGLLAVYRDALGGRLLYGGDNPEVGFRVVTLEYGPGSKVELIEPLAGSTWLDAFLARSGGRGGLHHVTFIVPELAAALDVLRARGIAHFGVRIGDPHWNEVFVHPRDNGGVLLQLAERGPDWSGGFWYGDPTPDWAPDRP